MLSKAVTILQHSSVVRPYALYALLKNLNVEAKLCTFSPHLQAKGEPAPDGPGPLILLGGPQSVYEQEQHPWLTDEIKYVRECLDQGHPAFGICLGGQILSHILGAEVRRCANPEVGWYPIKISKSAERLGLEEGEESFFEWHYDTFDLPKDVDFLFEGNATCRNQGYIWQNQVLSIQFHPEMTFEGAHLLREKFSVPQGTSLESCSCLKTEFEANAHFAHATLEKMLSWFLSRYKAA